MPDCAFLNSNDITSQSHHYQLIYRVASISYDVRPPLTRHLILMLFQAPEYQQEQ